MLKQKNYNGFIFKTLKFEFNSQFLPFKLEFTKLNEYSKLKNIDI